MITIVVVVGLELNYGLLLGKHDYLAYNALRLAQTVVDHAGARRALDRGRAHRRVGADRRDRRAPLWSSRFGLARSVSRVGLGRFDRRLGLRTLWYGVRGQGNMVASSLNARLDLAMLPAFVAPAGVGLYSVATNISLIVHQISNTFAGLVLPAAAGDRERAHVKVIGSLYATLVIAAVLGGRAGAARPPAAGPGLWRRLPRRGRAAAAAAPGRRAVRRLLDRHGRAVRRQPPVHRHRRPSCLGMLVTVVGLLVFLRTGGVNAAAIVSSAAYTTVFVATLVAYKRVTGLAWSWFAPTPARLRALIR